MNVLLDALLAAAKRALEEMANRGSHNTQAHLELELAIRRMEQWLGRS